MKRTKVHNPSLQQKSAPPSLYPHWQVHPFSSLLFVFFIIGTLLASGLCQATEVIPLSLEETVRRADAILDGTVKAKRSRWGDASHRWIVTEYTFSVNEVVHAQNGSHISNSVALTYWGGTID